MRSLLKKLNNAYYNNEDLLSVCHLPSDLKTLVALEQANCISIRKAWGGTIVGIKLGNSSEIYLIERSELWLNRILSYIAGIVTAVIVPFIAQLIKHV